MTPAQTKTKFPFKLVCPITQHNAWKRYTKLWRYRLVVCPMQCICNYALDRIQNHVNVRPSVRRLWTRMWRYLWTDVTDLEQIWNIASPYGFIPKRPKTRTTQTKTAHKFLTCPKRPNAGTKRQRAMTKTAHSWIRSVSCSACSLYE